ncbi:unnamed protein product [Phaedon cochleariae]|uniref:Uncharacterized protein n=1 Tax=Phaedon cochleariae TaxID=80249 RepID=A0A9N9WXA3_PHACE|nr:unnamed protein product [Phaedon cochleariae]
MDVELSLEEMENAVREAGLYESGMSRDEIKSCFNIVSESKDAASDENNSRRLSRSRQDLLNALNDKTANSHSCKKGDFKPKNWNSEKLVVSTLTKNELSGMEDSEDEFDLPSKTDSSKKAIEPSLSQILEDEENTDNPSNEDCIKDAMKASFGFNDMLESTENTLRFIPRKLEFIPIQYTKEFLKANNHKKAKMLYAYHTKMNYLRDQAARKSFFPAPMPVAISLNEHFNDFSDDLEAKETYVSRSGRQTKRKVYYENEDSSDGIITTKKTKNEVEWHGKKDKTKMDTKIETRSEAKIDQDIISNKQENEILNQTALVDGSNSTKKVLNENTKQTSSKPRQRKLTNAEIMKTSSLFAESPQRPSRTDIMFDKLKEQEVKRVKQEKSMESFEQTIENLDIESDDKSDEDISKNEIISVDDEEIVPRRVIPPLPGRKPINRRRNKNHELAPLDVKVSSTTRNGGASKNSQSPTSSIESAATASVKPLRKRQNINRSQSEIQIENVASTSDDHNSSLPSSTIECPMCGQYFLESKIEAHAWTCSDEHVSTRSSPRASRKQSSRITCHICDKVVPLGTHYEVHVRDCISKKQEQESQYH